MGLATALLLSVAAWGQVPDALGADAALVADDTSTATVGDALFGDLTGETPLSPEELALLKALGSETSTAHPDAQEILRWWPARFPRRHPETIVGRHVLDAPVARSPLEAFDAHPGILDGVRSERRRTVIIDGVRIDPDSAQRWLQLDPLFFESVSVRSPASLTDSTRLEGASLRLDTRSSRVGSGLGFDAAVTGRTSDRSAGVHAAASGGISKLGSLRVAGSYEDFDELRVRTGSTSATLGPAARRASVSARAQLFEPDAAVRLSFGGLLDHLVSETGGAVDFLDLVHVAFARGDVGTPALGLFALIAHQGRNQHLLEENDPAELRQSSTQLQSQLGAHWALLDALVVRGGGLVAFGEEDAPGIVDRYVRAKGTTRWAEGFLGAAYTDPTLEMEGALRIAHQLSRLDEEGRARVEVDDTRLLSQASVWALVTGPLGLRLGWSTGMHVPSLSNMRARIASGAALDRVETSRTVEGGPTFRTSSGYFEVLGFVAFVDRPPPIGGAVGALAARDEDRFLGIHLDTSWVLADRFGAALSMSWTDRIDASTPSASTGVPSLRGLASLRYDFPEPRAYVEAHVRFATAPWHVFSNAPSIAHVTADEPFVRLGMMAGVDLGAGFAARLAVENVLDGEYAPHDATIPGSGVDLRASLAYSYR